MVLVSTRMIILLRSLIVVLYHAYSNVCATATMNSQGVVKTLQQDFESTALNVCLEDLPPTVRGGGAS